MAKPERVLLHPGIIEEVGAGQPHCIDETLPADCTGFDGAGPHATNCSKYCSEVRRFIEAPRPGAENIFFSSNYPSVCPEPVLRKHRFPCETKAQKGAVLFSGAWHDPDMLVVGNTPCPGSKGMGCGTFTPPEEGEKCPRFVSLNSFTRNDSSPRQAQDKRIVSTSSKQRVLQHSHCHVTLVDLVGAAPDVK